MQWSIRTDIGCKQLVWLSESIAVNSPENNPTNLFQFYSWWNWSSKIKWPAKNSCLLSDIQSSSVWYKVPLPISAFCFLLIEWCLYYLNNSSKVRLQENCLNSLIVYLNEDGMAHRFIIAIFFNLNLVLPLYRITPLYFFLLKIFFLLFLVVTNPGTVYLGWYIQLYDLMYTFKRQEKIKLDEMLG